MRLPILEKLQTDLLDILYKNTEARDILQQLKSCTVSAEYQAWIDQMQPEMLEIGAELVKKWGVKSRQCTT